MKRALQAFVLAVFLVILFCIPGTKARAPEPSLAEHESREEVTIIFVGDVMLGRFVETLSEEFGYGYPFRDVGEFFKTADVVFANFEGVAPEAHTKTPINSFRLSFPESAVTALRDSGVTIVSLANNHTTDFGPDGFTYTKNLLDTLGISSFGHSRLLDDSSRVTFSQGGWNFHFFGLNETFGAHATSTIGSLLSNVPHGPRDFLIVSVHWGDEYKLSSNATQQALAHFLIDSGVDLVIGHHPHVIQEIEEYRGRLIFYSLGNFIFDQYFSEETKTGLAIRLTLIEGEETYELLPVYGKRSNPVLLSGEEKNQVLAGLSLRSAPSLESAISAGLLLLNRY